MKFAALREILEQHPGTLPRFILPDGDVIPSHAHVTEVGHVVKNFIDCGGLTGRNESVVLQTHVGRDIDHRLRADRFAKILQLGARVLPTEQLDVEIEYDCCVVAQYPVREVNPAGEHLDVLLGKRRTQCLAQERRKTADAETCCASESTACCN
ncbi:MAG: DUF6428 family protein [Chthoniobacterales bacterium]